VTIEFYVNTTYIRVIRPIMQAIYMVSFHSLGLPLTHSIAIENGIKKATKAGANAKT